MGQKASIVGRRTQSFKKLDEKRQEQQEEGTNISENITINKVDLEVQKKLKQLSDANLKRELEHQELTYKLQEQAEESCSLVNGLRSDLEDTKQKMCLFDNRVRELETQVLEEQKASSAFRKRAEELEAEIRSVRKQMETEIDLQRINKELENEKGKGEEARAKISALEQEMNVAMKELDLERRRLQDATDKITLVETHLREFETTTEEMKHLFGKQRDELNEMQTILIEVEQGIRDKDSVLANQTPKNGDITATEEPDMVWVTCGEAKSAEQLPADSSVAEDKSEQPPMLQEQQQLTEQP